MSNQHPFQDKLFVLIGNPERCTRQAARDALFAVGGVVDERITVFTDYVVSFQHNKMLKVYQQAVTDDRKGYLVLLDENQFWATLEDGAAPPEKKTNPRKGKVIVSEPSDSGAYARQMEESRQMIIHRKRLKHLAKYGTTSEGGEHAKIDLRPLDTMARVAKRLREQEDK